MPLRRPALLCCTALMACMAVTAPALASSEQRTATPFTLSSGTPRTPEQEAVRFDSARLAFDINPDAKTVQAHARLDFTAQSPVSAIVLELDTRFAIDGIQVGDTDITDWTNPEGRLTIPLPRSLEAGESVAVNIAYGGSPHPASRAPWDGGWVWSQSNGKPWIATAVQGEGCDLIWPCIDHPMGEPARVDMYITVPAGLSAPANGTLVSKQEHGDGSTTWHWTTRDPDTYAITLNFGPYQELSGQYESRYGNTIPMHFWALDSVPQDKAQGLFDQLPSMLDFFEEWVGPYPFADEKVGVVETPHLGMEHQTINAYGNGYKLDGKGYDWLLQHELAHEWFGNQMTNVSWDDMWLHEGFGTYMQPLYAYWLHGERAMQAELETMRRTLSNTHPLVSGEPQAAGTVYKAETGPALDLYYKGALIAHTLRMHIGDAAFKESLRRLVYDRADPQPGNFRPVYRTTADYLAIVNAVTGKEWGWFFDAYLYYAALPDLVMTRSADAVRLTWQTGSKLSFTLPVEVEIDGQHLTVDMPGGTAVFSAPASAHIILDPQSKILRRLPHIEEWKAAPRS
ncbi:MULTISPECIES: M1 family metallopeptidase [unclassified Brevundimonas]|uniref:M1 family metallopeptidase n=1 Tax=unclassified Brevundimonas TaxID=2622653 RepID=UPI0025B8CFD1|nr:MULTISPECIES: M1 family metallopeptidase [unclassified Brevundimonas]